MFSTSKPVCASSSNVFSWNIPVEEWSGTDVGGVILLHPFDVVVPPVARKVKFCLSVFPKGCLDTEDSNFVKVILFIMLPEEEVEVELGLFQIETAYRIRHIDAWGPLEMSNSRSYAEYHSKVFDSNKFVILRDSYEVGSVENRAEKGHLTFDFEIRTYSAPCLKFQFSGIRDQFVNNFGEVNRESGDMKIICDGKEFPCHKFLLVSQSPVFKAMFEMDSKEKEENVVNITDLTPDVILSFLGFLYRGILHLGPHYSRDLQHIFGLLNLANKYQIQLLIDCCMEALIDIMNVNNVLKMYAVVDKIAQKSEITDMVIDFMKKNVEAIVEKEDWPAFVIEYPSLLKNFVLNLNAEKVNAEKEASRYKKNNEEN